MLTEENYDMDTHGPPTYWKTEVEMVQNQVEEPASAGGGGGGGSSDSGGMAVIAGAAGGGAFCAAVLGYWLWRRRKLARSSEKELTKTEDGESKVRRRTLLL